jgi:hypothetical protein
LECREDECSCSLEAGVEMVEYFERLAFGERLDGSPRYGDENP